MDIQCYICHENVRIPVRFICFHCKQVPNQPSCNSMTRVCLSCAREYLQLNKRRSERITTRKCLTCPARVRCADLCASNAYEKDYILMKYDERTDYKCFHEHDGCTFKGTQNQLNYHTQNCPYRIISCRLCKMYFPANTEQDHNRSCQQRRQCSQCGDFIAYTEMISHYDVVHQFKPCHYCNHFIHTDQYNDHHKICPYVPHECIYCKDLVQKCQMTQHLYFHIIARQHDINNYNQLINNAVQDVQKLLNECQKYNA